MLNSKIIFAKGIKLDKNYNNVLDYPEEQMMTLVMNNRIYSSQSYQFIRPQNIIFSDIPYDLAVQANYIAFQNPDYSNKWFFAFIDNVIFKSKNNCEIEYTIDVFSTWFSYWNATKTYILREHTNDDTIGANTVAENLAVEEVVCEQTTSDISLSEYLYIAIMSSYSPGEDEDYNYITEYNSIVFGTPVFLIPFNVNENDNTNVTSMERLIKFIGGCVLKKRTEAIQAIFVLPSALIKTSDLILINNDDYYYYKLQYNNSTEIINYNINKRTTFSDYTPKNNKCFVYPYNYLEVTNMNGESNIYKYENFYSNNASFNLALAMQIGCSGRLFPINYKKKSLNNEESLALGKYPTFSWSGDAYVNWLTQNAVNNVAAPIMSIGGALIGAVVGGVPGAIIGASGASMLLGMGGSIDPKANREMQNTINTAAAGIGSLGLSISNTVLSSFGNFYAGSLISNIPTGTNTGEANFSYNQMGFKFNEMRAKTEYLKKIDEFFSLYGYKTNSLKTPNISGRKTWNYVEIAPNSVIGYGDVPSNFMEIINNIFRKGVTIWHNHQSLGNYNLDNSII